MINYTNKTDKELVQQFINDLNSVLMKHDVSLDLIETSCYFNKKGYAGFIFQDQDEQKIKILEETLDGNQRVLLTSK